MADKKVFCVLPRPKARGSSGQGRFTRTLNR